MSDWTLVRARGLAKWWAPGVGLNPVDLEIDRNELLVVRGRSGSGKSTLVGLLAGWCEPDEGGLDWCGLAPGESPAQWRVVSFAPQVLAPVTELSVLENVALPLRAGGMPRHEANERAAEVLAAVDLTAQARRPADAVSLGQQQRMSVARAAVVRPALLVADEPTSHQDAGHVDAVVSLLRDVARTGTACVVVTHDPAVAARADRVLDLDA